ncbi:MAG: ABC transporter ATP-binding protein [Clostridiales bacterium]|nr:ABC transporter ATP-binding protein [Clostridiales bacterium]
MFKLIKYLKKSKIAILAIFALLILQAVCDLALPDYTSKIVNVGIQQNGVVNSVPDAISEEELNKIVLFMDEDDKAKVLDNYSLIKTNEATDKQKEKYTELNNKNIYELNKIDKELNEELNDILGKPILIVSGFEKGGDEVEVLRNQLISALPPQATNNGQADIFQILENLPKEQLDNMLSEITSKFDEMPDTIITQMSVSYIKDEYKNIGIDVDSMQSKYVLIAGAKMLSIALLSMAASVIVGYMAAKVSASLGRNLRAGVFKKVLSFSNTEMDKFSTASLITRSTNDIQQIQLLMVMLLRIVFYAPILGIGGVIKVLNTNTSMSWIIALAVLIILSVVLLLFAIVMPKFKIVQKLVDKLNLVTREILTGLPVIRAFSTEKYEEKRFDKANRDLTKTNLFVNRIMSCMMPFMMFVMNGIAVLIVWKGAHSINDGAMQVGDMMAFIQYTMQIIMAFLMISMVSIMLPRASVSALRIDEVLTSDVVIKDEKDLATFKNNSGLLEFKNVSFRYPNADENVIENISFEAKPGETTAFIGSTGSGKSTLINLIPRFYDITEGEIKLDGVDIRKVSQHELREKIGYVPQKGVLFSGTIESNLKYGNDNITDEDMVKAAEIAQSTDFITAKNDEYKSEISQGGTNVSGGQKQRLSIARAIAKNPEVYIFDDSFSALDFKTDSLLRKALKKVTGDKTVLIVAQRISTILHAEQIIVLDEGKIVGKGTHKELLKNCEVYRQIASSQLSKEELENE